MISINNNAYWVTSWQYELPFKWDNLTLKQKAASGNGCGPQGWPIQPPSFCFKASCYQHDFNYWRGGTKEDRKRADVRFLKAMLEDTRRYAHNRLNLIRYRAWAWLYYKAVRIFGASCFTYRAKRINSWSAFTVLILVPERDKQ